LTIKRKTTVTALTKRKVRSKSPKKESSPKQRKEERVDFQGKERTETKKEGGFNLSRGDP